MSYTSQYRSWLTLLLGREIKADDGLATPYPIALPASLAHYYALAGAIACINQPHNRLVAPEALSVEDGMLIFMEENQCVAYWGIREQDLNLPDPLVYQGVNGDEIEWHSEQMTVSAWLPVMVYWQIVNGGFEFGAYAEVATISLDEIRRHYPALTSHVDGALHFFGESGQVIAVSPNNAGGAIWAAGQTQEDLERIMSRLSVDWDYCYLDELPDE